MLRLVLALKNMYDSDRGWATRLALRKFFYRRSDCGCGWGIYCDCMSGCGALVQRNKMIEARKELDERLADICNERKWNIENYDD